MTIQEKRHKLKNFCLKRVGCSGCPLKDFSDDCCYPVDNEKIIDRNYQAVFGGESDAEEATATTIKEAVPLEAITEDADTIIKIKSSRKIDNITIYFKED